MKMVTKDTGEGDLEKAKNLMEKALPILEQHFGPDNYMLAFSLRNLSDVYAGLGNSEKQNLLMSRALAVVEKHGYLALNEI